MDEREILNRAEGIIINAKSFAAGGRMAELRYQLFKLHKFLTSELDAKYFAVTEKPQLAEQPDEQPAEKPDEQPAEKPATGTILPFKLPESKDGAGVVSESKKSQIKDGSGIA